MQRLWSLSSHNIRPYLHSGSHSRHCSILSHQVKALLRMPYRLIPVPLPLHKLYRSTHRKKSKCLNQPRLRRSALRFSSIEYLRGSCQVCCPARVAGPGRLLVCAAVAYIAEIGQVTCFPLWCVALRIENFHPLKNRQDL